MGAESSSAALRYLYQCIYHKVRTWNGRNIMNAGALHEEDRTGEGSPGRSPGCLALSLWVTDGLQLHYARFLLKIHSASISGSQSVSSGPSAILVNLDAYSCSGFS